MTDYRVSIASWPHIVEVECSDPEDIRDAVMCRLRNIDGVDPATIEDVEIEETEDLSALERADNWNDEAPDRTEAES